MIERVHLGGPVWSCPKWVGSLFPEGARAPSFLEHYARVFNAVEGNSTFYAVPPASTFAKWRDATPDGFKFCLKVPRTITHDRMLVGADGPWAQFLHASAELGDRLGPTMIQLPPTFGPPRLDALLRCLDALPRDRSWAVEPRHPAFFGGTAAERALDAALRDRAIDRVIFDATVLHASTDPAVAIVQGRKPRLPIPEIATAQHPVVRLVGVGTPGAFDAVLETWADRVATWIGAGLSPHVFVHTADDVDVPALCGTFHAMLSRRTDVGTVGAWNDAAVRRGGGQISLFET